VEHARDDLYEPRGLVAVLLPRPAVLAADERRDLFWEQLSAAEGEELVPLELFAL